MEQIRLKYVEFSDVVKRDEAAGLKGKLSENAERILEEAHALRAVLDEEMDRMLKLHPIPEGLLEALEAAEKPVMDERYWRRDVHDAPTTTDLDEEAKIGLEALLPLVDPEWLAGQAKLNFRLRYDSTPSSARRLHLVGRERLLPEGANRPHRFAEMILVGQDFVAGRSDVDFIAASSLVTELATLGQSLDEILQLGAEAHRKLAELPLMPSDQVASTIYELFVGAACIRKGTLVEMLPAGGPGKSPDYRVKDHIVPVVLECKRRDGFPQYVEKEARSVERLFDATESTFEKYHLCVEVDFTAEPTSVPIDDWASTIDRLAQSWDGFVEERQPWGHLRATRLPIEFDCSPTRIYSPVFLKEIFDWDHQNDEWDCILCEVDPIARPATRYVQTPRCLKWKCSNAKSMLKKSRGLTSLWADAVNQIPIAEMGIIYVAYSEFMRPSLADARTQHLISTSKNEWFHRWGIVNPLTIVNRLYPQPRGDGAPDFIESVMPLVADDSQYLLRDFPISVFTPRRT